MIRKRVLDDFTYGIGLFGTCAALWLGYVAVAVQADPPRGTEVEILRAALWLWLASMPYPLA